MEVQQTKPQMKQLYDTQYKQQAPFMDMKSLVVMRVDQLKKLGFAKPQKKNPSKGLSELVDYAPTESPELARVGKIIVNYETPKKATITYTLAKLDEKGNIMRYNDENTMLRGYLREDMKILKNQFGSMIKLIGTKIIETIDKNKTINVIDIKTESVDNKEDIELYRLEQKKDFWIRNPDSYSPQAIADTLRGKSNKSEPEGDVKNDNTKNTLANVSTPGAEANSNK